MDEFVLRKGHIYGTILVDIETRRPVDLLPGRSVPVVARWLADRPGVEVICRDRSTAYAEATACSPRTWDFVGSPGTVSVTGRAEARERIRQLATQHLATPIGPTIASQ
ncbi:transposase [Streptomyces sp. NPDC021098]|uniref:transposase n=1 Tax=unclassified Streptomyces TaxID=2593676 RepID=UPI00379BD919